MGNPPVERGDSSTAICRTSGNKLLVWIKQQTINFGGELMMRSRHAVSAMSEPQNPSSAQNLPSSSTPTKVSGEIGNGNTSYSAQKPRFPNPPDPINPDPATLREQWRFAIRQYSKWYSHAWGTAILAGLSFFALGWIIKGSNPLPSRHDDSPARPSTSSPSDAGDAGR